MKGEYTKLQQYDVEQWNSRRKIVEYRSENRYSDVIPYADTAVRLKDSDFSDNGYINASYIKIGEEVSIAAQGPLEGTVYKFLQLVWETLAEVDCVNIIMLTELSESGREKCFDYVSGLEEDLKFVFQKLGDWKVEYKGMYHIGVNEGIEVREFMIEDDEKRTKMVRHIWVREWPDFGIPSVDNDNNLFLVKWLQEKNGDGIEYKNIVHCSAGVGRSGTFIALDYLYRHGADKKDIFRVVLAMRRCRVMMVQRFSQYEYLYKAIK